MYHVVQSRSSLTEKYLADLNRALERKELEVRNFNEGWWTLYILSSPINYHIVKLREGKFFGRWERLAYVEPEPIEGAWRLAVEKPHEDAIRRVADEMRSKGYEMDVVVNGQKTTR